MNKIKIVVMSDSHGCNGRIYELLENEKNVDLYLHCGDICEDSYVFPQIITVSGNNDYYDYPFERVIKVGNHRILMLHSHTLYFLKKEEKMIELAKENHCDIVCYGHTHVAEYHVNDGIHILNPGSLYHSRDGKPISYAIMMIEDEKVSVEIKYITD